MIIFFHRILWSFIVFIFNKISFLWITFDLLYYTFLVHCPLYFLVMIYVKMMRCLFLVRILYEFTNFFFKCPFIVYLNRFPNFLVWYSCPTRTFLKQKNVMLLLCIKSWFPFVAWIDIYCRWDDWNGRYR